MISNLVVQKVSSWLILLKFLKKNLTISEINISNFLDKIFSYIENANINFLEIQKLYFQKIDTLLSKIPKSIFLELFNDSSPEKVKSKTYLLNSNEVCKSIFLIQKGTAWKFYLKDRTKIATEFVFAEDIILSHSSYLLQIPSKEYIQVLEDSLVYRIEFGKFENMIQKYPILNELDKLILEYNSLKLEDRLNHLLFKTPKEKLEWLLSREPKVLEKIPKKYLASYLGVTLETISRLKKFD